MNNDRKNLKKKIVKDYSILNKVIDAQRTLGHKIVVTIGSWDLLHIGHTRYLLEASKYGDILVVGVDSDSAIKLYKGQYRPIVPETERMEMLTYLGFVDYITIVDDLDAQGQWQYELIKLLRPNMFIAVEDSYPEEQLEHIREFCSEVKVLPRQAESTSSSDIVQGMLKGELFPIINEISGFGKKITDLADKISKGGKR